MMSDSYYLHLEMARAPNNSDIRGKLMKLIPSVLMLCIFIWNCHQTQMDQVDAGLELFFQNELQRAQPIFQAVVRKNSDNAQAHMWLAEIYRRQGKIELAREHAARALELEPCNSFAHVVMANTHWPLPQASDVPETHPNWVHLMEAIWCDSTDGNAWISLWGEGIRHDKPELVRKSVRVMAETGFLTPAALAYGRWILRYLPEHAILLTNGDMDTYPAQAVIEAEGFRPDVTVLEREHLTISWGMHYLRKYENVPIPFGRTQIDSLGAQYGKGARGETSADKIFQIWANQVADGTFPRPIALATTVEESFYEKYRDRLLYSGPYLLLMPHVVEDSVDAETLEQAVLGIRQNDFTGPFASKLDYSPIRRLYARYLAKSLADAALIHIERLIDSRRQEEASQMLDWLEGFEQTTELGPVSDKQIERLRNLLS